MTEEAYARRRRCRARALRPVALIDSARFRLNRTERPRSRSFRPAAISLRSSFSLAARTSSTSSRRRRASRTTSLADWYRPLRTRSATSAASLGVRDTFMALPPDSRLEADVRLCQFLTSRTLTRSGPNVELPFPQRRERASRRRSGRRGLALARGFVGHAERLEEHRLDRDRRAGRRGAGLGLEEEDAALFLHERVERLLGLLSLILDVRDLAVLKPKRALCPFRVDPQRARLRSAGQDL